MLHRWTPALSLLCALAVLAPSSVRAADYWPDEATRTYVFGEDAPTVRLVIDPRGGETAFRVLSRDCEVSWTADVEASGRLTARDGLVDCPDRVETTLPIEFENGAEVLFDPAWIGGATQQIQGSVNGEAQNLYVRVGEPRQVVVPDGTFEAVRFRIAADPFFIVELLSIDLARDAGPVRVEDLGRVAVLEGIVSSTPSSWSALKARFEAPR